MVSTPRWEERSVDEPLREYVDRPADRVLSTLDDRMPAVELSRLNEGLAEAVRPPERFV